MTPAPARPLSLSTKLFYGVGSVAFGVKDNGFSYLLLIFYNQVIGLPSAKVGLAIMIALAIDAAMDPFVGQLSDGWRSRWGRRHPFMYAAALPAALSYLLLWTPPAGWSEDQLFLYLVVVAVVIRSFITLYEIPSLALAAELTRDYDERTRVLSFRHFFGWCGALTMALLAFKVFLRPDAEHPVGQLNPEGYAQYGVWAAVIMAAAILISAAGTHRHIPSLPQAPPPRAKGRGVLREMAQTLANRAFLVLMGAGLFNAMATGLVLSLTLYLNTYFWEFSADQIAIFTLGNFVSAALALTFTAPIARALGKRRGAMATKLVALVVGVTPIALRLLGVLPDNGAPVLMPVVLLQTTVSTAASISSAILVSSMIADVVEASELRTGRRSEGLFFASAAFVSKAVSGVGIFLSSMILAFVAFPERARPGQVDAGVVEALGVTYLGALVLLYAGALAFIAGYRITRGDHEDALARLAARRVDEGAVP